MSLQQGPNYTGFIILLIERPVFICCSCRPTAHETERGTLALTGRHTGPHLFIGAERVQIINEKQTRTHWDHRSKSQEKECDCRWTRQRRQTFCVKKHVIQMSHPWAQSRLRWNLWSRGGVHMEIRGNVGMFWLVWFFKQTKKIDLSKVRGKQESAILATLTCKEWVWEVIDSISAAPFSWFLLSGYHFTDMCLSPAEW